MVKWICSFCRAPPPLTFIDNTPNSLVRNLSAGACVIYVFISYLQAPSSCRRYSRWVTTSAAGITVTRRTWRPWRACSSSWTILTTCFGWTSSTRTARDTSRYLIAVYDLSNGRLIAQMVRRQWDKAVFPNPIEMQQNLSAHGRKMVTIVDPHIKRDENVRIATSNGL